MKFKDRKILLVDDEPDIREIIRFELELEGAKIFEANNGNEAMEVVLKESPHLVISDIRMPISDGVDLLTRLKQHNPLLPMLIFITGYSDLTDEEAYQKGADAILSKPIDMPKLISCVERSLLSKKDLLASRAERHDVFLNVKFTSPSLDAAIQGKITNIGRGGLFISATAPFPKLSDKVSFDIQFDNNVFSPIIGIGEVRWVRVETGTLPTGFGIEFVELNAKSLDSLLEYVSKKKTIAYIPNS